MYDAKIVADSIMSEGHRLTTMEVVMPRIVLAEFNTHRALSRNSASSRAIPFKKMADTVEANSFVPLAWMKDHPGMQGQNYFTKEEAETLFIPETHFIIRDIILKYARRQNDRGLTKQLCNRYLETFMWHKVLVSATEWENFFALRAHPDAEIHIQKVAETMLECMNASDPKFLKPGEWHIPYGDQLRIGHEEYILYQKPGEGITETINRMQLQIATARCAQVSYTVIGADDKPMDYAKLIALHDRLAESGHWSPFEHCAMAEYPGSLAWGRTNGWFGNFRGFKQYRKMFKDENRKDSRLIKKEVPNV